MISVLGKIFYIIVFVSLVGSVYSLLALFAIKVLHIALPLWFGVCGLGFYLLPWIAPAVWLVSPEKTSWVDGYRVACGIWLIGVIVFTIYFITRNLLAYRALQKYRVNGDERIHRVFDSCMVTTGLKKAPVLYFGTIHEPACVVTLFRSAIILNETIVAQLTDKELAIILCHELMHIKRAHSTFQHIFDFASILHWFNPFVWISKNDFAAYCEIDCDQKALSVMNGEVTGMEYAAAMLHLMELSSNQRSHTTGGMAALGFLLAKQRIGFILNAPTRGRWRNSVVVLALIITITVLFSIHLSRTYFYPYPALNTAPEYPAYTDTLSGQ